jgi:hypothetical protein
MMYNSEFFHPSPYPLTGQQEPTPHATATMHRKMTIQTPNTLPDVSNKQRQYRMTSTIEEEDDTNHNSNNEWQAIRRTKRKKLHSTPPTTPTTLTKHIIATACSQKRQTKKTQKDNHGHYKIIDHLPFSSTELSITGKW